jgi:hypothetical protein
VKKLGFELEPRPSVGRDDWTCGVMAHFIEVVTPAARRAVESAVVVTGDDAPDDVEFTVSFRVKMRRTDQ